MASRNLGTLTIDLVAKTGGFTQGLSKAERELESRSRRMNQIAKKIGTGIGVAITAGLAAGTAVAANLKLTIDRMDELSKAAQRAQLPTEQFSQLAYAGDLADVSMQDLTTSFGRLARAQADAARGLKTQSQAFEQLGIEFKNQDGTLRDSTEVFKDFADAYQKFRGSPEVLAAGMQIFGRSFQNLIPLLKDGREGLEAAAEEADRLNITLGTEAGKNAEEFNDNLTRLKTAFNGLTQALAEELLPDLIKLTQQLNKIAADGSTVQSVVSLIGDQARAAAADFKFFEGTLRDIGLVLSGLKEGAQSTGAALAAIARFDRKGLANALAQGRAADLKVLSGLSGSPDFGNVQGTPDFSNVRGTPGPANTPPPIPGAAGKTAKKQLTDEEKAAQALQRAYESLTESMRERIALFGEESEVAKVTYEIQQGSLKGLEEGLQKVVLAQAAELDALQERQKIEEEGKRLIESLVQPHEAINSERERALELLQAGAIAQEDYNRAIESYRTPAEQMLEDIQLEIELLGKTREEQELLTAARYLGAEAATAQGQAALQAMRDMQEAARATRDQIQLMDEFRSGASDLITDLVTGAKSAKEAFTDFFDSIAERITQMIAERWIEQLFGQQGSTGQGTSGGNWLSAIFGAFGFGGGKASGGWAMPNTAYEVNERGFEMATVRGRDFLLTGGSPVQITPNHMLGSGVNQTNQFYYSAPPDPRTQQQTAQRVGFEARRATARNGA